MSRSKAVVPVPDLQAGSVITGTDAPPAVTSGVETTNQSPVSTSYAAGTACGVVFYAPTTGRVLIEWRSFIDNNTAGAHTLLSIEVRTGNAIGSGTVVLDPSDEYSLQHEGTNQLRLGAFYPLDGLDPGDQYNVRLMHRVTGGTGTLDDREVMVTPLP
jgi:hypothetical protein